MTPCRMMRRFGWSACLHLNHASRSRKRLGERVLSHEYISCRGSASGFKLLVGKTTKPPEKMPMIISTPMPAHRRRALLRITPAITTAYACRPLLAIIVYTSSRKRGTKNIYPDTSPSSKPGNSKDKRGPRSETRRIVVAIQREIEMVGIPTVLITLLPDNSRPAGPPRAIAPQRFKLGNCLGGPHQNKLQRHVLEDALRRWEAREEPGTSGR